jgi:hypothetical protein
LQTTFDQAVLGSYAAGRYAKLTDPDVLAARPIWQYTTAGDSRVRPAHRAMNRRTFPADSPVWATWFPPNGWRCRCSVLSLSNDQVAEAGIKVEDSVPPVVEHDGQIVNMLPDPGFSGSPATQRAADRTVAAIDREADRTGALRQVPDDLNRAADAKRRAKVDAFAGLDEKGVEERFKDAFVWNAEDAPEMRPGLLTVDWHMYSQNLDSAEQLVTRLVQTDGLYPLKDRAGVAARATFFGEWDPAKWTDPEVVYDDELAAKLGRPKGMTVARSTEYALRLFVKPAELEQTLAFLDENGERTGQGKRPVRRAWDIQDVRVHAPAGVAAARGRPLEEGGAQRARAAERQADGDAQPRAARRLAARARHRQRQPVGVPAVTMKLPSGLAQRAAALGEAIGVDALKARVQQLEGELLSLAEMFHTHVRTDIAPDAALPAAKRFVKKLQRRYGGRR